MQTAGRCAWLTCHHARANFGWATDDRMPLVKLDLLTFRTSMHLRVGGVPIQQKQKRANQSTHYLRLLQATPFEQRFNGRCASPKFLVGFHGFPAATDGEDGVAETLAVFAC